ncbi:MAG: WYL domain-containing protein [Bacteroidales bacterium]|nr:WYL domain-containing protein [Bacteroidales bacterium]
MSKGEYYSHYIWLMNTLLQAKRITFDEINARWERDWCCSLPKRTFHQYKMAVQEMFEVTIDCDTSNGYQYYISNIENFKTDRSRQWLLNSFCASNLVKAGEQIKDRIVYEDIPENSEYLSFVVDAMKRNCKLEITYLPYEAEAPVTYVVCPYCMRLYRQHWYVLGFSETHQALRHFAINRMKNLVLTDTPFVYPDDFTPESYYYYSSGIYVDDSLPLENIRLRTYGNLWHYYQTLPLHHTQKLAEKNDDYADFEYRLRVTPEFMMELLSRGDKIEVLEPQSLRERMKEELQKTLKRYKK